MAKIKKFRVRLLPAEYDVKPYGTFIVTKFTMFMGDKYPTYDIEAESVDELIEKIGVIAEAHGEGCAASVRCLEKRKPNGFDAKTKRLYFNLKEKEEAA